MHVYWIAKYMLPYNVAFKMNVNKLTLNYFKLHFHLLFISTLFLSKHILFFLIFYLFERITRVKYSSKLNSMQPLSCVIISTNLKNPPLSAYRQDATIFKLSISLVAEGLSQGKLVNHINVSKYYTTIHLYRNAMCHTLFFNEIVKLSQNCYSCTL